MQQFSNSLFRQFPNSVTGNAATGVSVNVYELGTTNAVTLYADDDLGGATLPNPLTTNDIGFYSFYAPDGKYTLNFGSIQFPDLNIQLIDALSLVNEFNTAQAATGFILIDNGFSAGYNITQRNEALLFDGIYYVWKGALNKTVPPASSPATTGGIGNGAWQAVLDNALRQQLLDGTAVIGGRTAEEVAIFANSVRPVIFADDATPAERTTALLSTLDANDAVYVTAGEYGITNITQSGKTLYLDPNAYFKLPNGSSNGATIAAISPFKVTGDDVRAVGKITVDGNLANNASSGVNTSDRRGAVHVAGSNFVFDQIEVNNAYWVGFSIGSNVDAGTVVGNHVRIVNPRSYGTSLWDSTHDIGLIEVIAGADSLDARIRTGSQTSSPEKTSSGIIHSIQTNDTVVIEANSKKLSVSACIAKALKVEDSEDIGLPESMHLNGATTEAFTFAVLSSKGVSWGTVNVRDHAGTNGVPAVRLSEIEESGGEKISVKGTISNVRDVDIRSAKDLTIATIECLDPVGTGGGFLFDYDVGYAPQENIRIGQISSRGHTGLDVEVQNFQNVDIRIGNINSDATTNQTELKSKGAYFDGTFSASVSTAGGSVTMNGSFDTLAISKNGRRVDVSGQIRLSAISSPTGAVYIEGLTFTASNEPELAGLSVGTCHVSNFATYTGRIVAQISESENRIYLFRQDGNVTSDIGVLLQANSAISISINYVS